MSITSDGGRTKLFPCQHLQRGCLLSVLLAFGTPPAFAETALFDDFSDGSVSNNVPLDRDGMPVVWTPLSGFDNGTFDATSGDFVLANTQAAAALVSLATTNPLGDTSIRTQMRREGDPGVAAVFARADPVALAAYQAGISTNTGNAYITRNDAPNGTPVLLLSTPSPVNVGTSDAMLQFDVFDNNLDLYVWPGDAPKPDQPLLSVVDNTLSGGVPGFLLDGSGFGTATFRFIHVADTSIPEPASVLLITLGGLALFVSWRRLVLPRSR